MKTKLMAGLASTIMFSLLFTAYQPGNAVPYYGHDGSVDERLTKYQSEPLKGKKDFWVYSVKTCATDHNMAIAGVILKSDIDQKVLGVNKVIKKGDCMPYGAVMKAKDGSTLGATLIERHEALEKYNNVFNDWHEMSKSQHKEAQKEWLFYRAMLGL